MEVDHFFRTDDHKVAIFRRKHPGQSLRGLPGVFALTAEIDFSIQPLHFEAANDLVCVDQDQLPCHPMYNECNEFGRVGVAVCVMPRTTESDRKALARRLNAGEGLADYAA